jgi:hypothetical protein
MSKDKKNDSGITDNTDKNGRDDLGRFTTGNDGRPKGITNKTTRDLRDFVVNFLNGKTPEISTLWDTLDNKDKLSLFMHLCRLVLPKPTDDTDREDGNQLSRRPIINFVNPDVITGMEIIDSGAQNLTKEQIDKLIDKL